MQREKRDCILHFCRQRPASRELDSAWGVSIQKRDRQIVIKRCKFVPSYRRTEELMGRTESKLKDDSEGGGGSSFVKYSFTSFPKESRLKSAPSLLGCTKAHLLGGIGRRRKEEDWGLEGRDGTSSEILGPETMKERADLAPMSSSAAALASEASE